MIEWYLSEDSVRMELAWGWSWDVNWMGWELFRNGENVWKRAGGNDIEKTEMLKWGWS